MEDTTRRRHHDPTGHHGQDPNAAQPPALLFHNAPDLFRCCADGTELSIALYFVVYRNTENTLDDYISAGKHKSSYAEDGCKANGP